jgi:hypothetical protein
MVISAVAINFFILFPFLCYTGSWAPRIYY